MKNHILTDVVRVLRDAVIQFVPIVVWGTPTPDFLTVHPVTMHTSLHCKECCISAVLYSYATQLLISGQELPHIPILFFPLVLHLSVKLDNKTISQPSYLVWAHLCTSPFIRSL